MDATEMVKLISSLGFPIAMCVWFMWRDYKFMSAFSNKLDKIVLLMEIALKQPFKD